MYIYTCVRARARVWVCDTNNYNDNDDDVDNNNRANREGILRLFVQRWTDSHCCSVLQLFLEKAVLEYRNIFSLLLQQKYISRKIISGRFRTAYILCNIDLRPYDYGSINLSIQ
jgi:hypothetical protein